MLKNSRGGGHQTQNLRLTVARKVVGRFLKMSVICCFVTESARPVPYFCSNLWCDRYSMKSCNKTRNVILVGTDEFYFLLAPNKLVPILLMRKSKFQFPPKLKIGQGVGIHVKFLL